VHSPFEILKKEPNGSFLWFEAVNDLESANCRIKDLIGLSPGEYIVVDQRTHSVVVSAPRYSSRVDSRRE
jgi:hypothetical protein